MKVLVIEDEPAVQKDILGLLKLIGNIEVLQVIDSVEKALQLLPDTTADVVLMDVNLKDGTAFDIIRQLPAPHFNLIFITAYEQYAINAIKIGALDYLLKPVDITELKAALVKVKPYPVLQKQFDTTVRAIENNADKIVLKNTEGFHFILFSDLMYCRGSGSYTHFYTADGKFIMVSKPLKDYSDILPSAVFIKCHQSYTVNKNFIKKLNRDDYIELKTGDCIPVAYRRKDLVIDAIMK